MSRRSRASIVLQLILVVAVVPLLPMLVSWRWDWWEAWVFALTLFLGFVLSRALAGRRHPGLLAERAGPKLRRERVHAGAVEHGLLPVEVSELSSNSR